eukprot:CAMPEP_0197469362 /NCGR_PEP_ID=MMETSP1175-20131217/66565_1 /TAXON_ID=1003142 /ORGANISM="Triceratium dubium, Strain CCMP147" /LENGTH=147 /DNA_ID=CAMNT_0043005503 /DNA_START=290 /DNA_END=730 /DNA_ORIENTATION=+
MTIGKGGGRGGSTIAGAYLEIAPAALSAANPAPTTFRPVVTIVIVAVASLAHSTLTTAAAPAVGLPRHPPLVEAAFSAPSAVTAALAVTRPAAAPAADGTCRAAAVPATVPTAGGTCRPAAAAPTSGGPAGRAPLVDVALAPPAVTA